MNLKERFEKKLEHDLINILPYNPSNAGFKCTRCRAYLVFKDDEIIIDVGTELDCPLTQDQYDICILHEK